MASTIQQINGIRKYFVENKMFSELRGFNAGVRIFSNPPNEKLRVAIEASKRIKKKISQWESKQQNAMSKFGRKPTFDEAYQRVVAGDEEFAGALKLAYPELHHDVMQKLYKETPYGVPPPYARLYSDNKNKESFWKRHKRKILAGAALAAAAGLGYGAKSLLDRYGNAPARQDATSSSSTGTPAEDARTAPASDSGSKTQPPKDDKQGGAATNSKTDGGETDLKYLTKEERDGIFKPLETKMQGVTDFTPHADLLLSVYDKYCKALETKYIRPEDVRSETEMLKGSTNLFLTLQQQLAQNGGDSDKITKVANMIGRLSRITLKIGTAPAR